MYRLNTELSIEAEKHFGDNLQPKGCYENVYKQISSPFFNGTCEVLFCYLSTQNSTPVVVRHAFLLVDGDIVEPLEHLREGLIVESIIQIAKLSHDEYLDHLLKGKRYDCWPILLAEEIEALAESHAIINPFEASDFVSLFAKDATTGLMLLQAAQQGDYEPFKVLIPEIVGKKKTSCTFSARRLK